MKRFLASLLLLVAPAASAQTKWLDVNGDPLPFADDSAVLDFLRTAPVVAETDIGVGVNRSQKLTLEKDGVRAHGIFRQVDLRRRNHRVGDRYYFQFADSYLFECAAYELATMLGLDGVPPAVLRTIRGRNGSLQIWLKDVLDEEGSAFKPPNPSLWAQQIWAMHLFDNLVFNVDRNKGNTLVDADYRLWLIDHTRAFQVFNKLLDDRIVRVNRDVFERLVAMSDGELRTALGSFLTDAEMASLLRRRKILIEHVEAFVAERGEEVVFY